MCFSLPLMVSLTVKLRVVLGPFGSCVLVIQGLHSWCMYALVLVWHRYTVCPILSLVLSIFTVVIMSGAAAQGYRCKVCCAVCVGSGVGELGYACLIISGCPNGTCCVSP